MGDAVSAILLVFGVGSLVSIVVTGTLIDRHLRALMISSTSLFGAAMIVLGFLADAPLVVFVGAAVWGLAFRWNGKPA